MKPKSKKGGKKIDRLEEIENDRRQKKNEKNRKMRMETSRKKRKEVGNKGRERTQRWTQDKWGKSEAGKKIEERRTQGKKQKTGVK